MNQKFIDGSYLILHVDEVLSISDLLDVALGDGGIHQPALLAVHELRPVLIEDGRVRGNGTEELKRKSEHCSSRFPTTLFKATAPGRSKTCWGRCWQLEQGH